MYKKSCFIFLFFICITSLYGKDISVLSSPNGYLKLKLIQKNDLTSLSIMYKNKIVIPQIDLGIQCNGTNYFKNLKCLEVSIPQQIDENYVTIHGKKKNRSNRANVAVGRFQSLEGLTLNIELRLYNDGACFRYLFPESRKDSLLLTDEFTTYHINEKNKRWLQKYVTSYEGDFLYQKDEILQGEWGYPALIGNNDCWALITEAGLNRNYCATHLNNMGNLEKYKVSYPDKKEGNGIGEICSRTKAPWASPWRVVIIGTLGDIVESTLVEDVSAPCKFSNTDWIYPGRSAWVYWAYNHGTQDYQLCKSYVDLAEKMDWEYVLFDWEWDQMQNGGTLEDAAHYAKSKGIKPLLWYNSGGNHNSVSSTPRDRLITHEDRMKEFAWLKNLGFAGIKVDFFESDKQHMINYYLDLLEDAAACKLLINLHGCTVPRGWSRTYPNLISMEAVYGAEQYNNSRYMTDNGARLNCIFPFTRNVVGPMDYTPVAFTNSQHPHHTSNTHELALSVIFESGIQHWADRPEGFYQLSDEAKSFMSTVPVAWDDTRFIEGYPGKYIVLARRKGTTWYLAGINGTDSHGKLRISLDFLQDTDYQMVLFSDGKENSQIRSQHKQVNRTDSIEIEWKAEGGFVACLKCDPN